MAADEDSKKSNLTFFIQMFPIVLLAILSFISVEYSSGAYYVLMIAKILLVAFQAILLKNFIESTYS